MATPAYSEVCELLAPLVGQQVSRDAVAQLAGKFMDMCLGRPLPLYKLPPHKVGSYSLQAERLSLVLNELAPMHRAHWEETEAYRHGLPFSPDYEWALQAEAAGEYMLLTARTNTDKSRALVGNYGLLLTKSRHTQTLVAQEDTMFIAPAHRRGRLFHRFSEYGELAALTFGARELRLTTKTTNQVGQMLPRMGYKHVANQYVKVLDEGASNVR